ncbi:hypothetical protein Tco_1290872, partial [Tanacetum coccineum]
YPAAVAVSDVPGYGSRVHTHDHGGSEAPDRSPDSILSSEPKLLEKHKWKRIFDKRTKNEAKNDKTKHKMEKSEKAWKSQSQIEAKKSTQVKVKSTPEKSTVKTGADTEEYLMGPP